jgi:outer membrane protein OmpA-like peptidoglycan-associated protein
VRTQLTAPDVASLPEFSATLDEVSGIFTKKVGLEFARHQQGIVGVLPTASAFTFDSAVLSPSGRESLRALADAMRSFKAFRLLVVVHSDSFGPDDHNRSLTMDRAEAIRSYLLSLGTSEDNVRAIGAGETEPLASNGDEQGRASNRRIEFGLYLTEAAKDGLRRLAETAR